MSMKQFFLVLLICFMAAPVDAAKKKKEPDPDKYSMKEVQAGVMSFADAWGAYIGQTSENLAVAVDTPQARLQVKRFQFYSTLAAYDIAAGPYPGVAMLDMMVLASLTRRSWENHWQTRYGEPASLTIKALNELEANIWAFGANILTPRQVEAMRELVDEWWQKHPNAREVEFVRFSDFGELGRKPSIEAAVKKGGFLSPIRDVAQSADDFKELSERGIYLAIRMQELLAGRFEITMMEFMQSQEMVQLLGDVHGVSGSAERYADVAERYAEILETIPDELKSVVVFTLAEVTRERTAAINQMFEEVATERNSAIEQMLQGVAKEREMTLEQTLSGLEHERVGLLKAIAHVAFWMELEMEALVLRLFLAFAGLIALWFSLRLVYRYWVDRVANNFIKTIGAMLLILISSASIMLIGIYMVKITTPDLSEQAEFQDRLIKLIDETHLEGEEQTPEG
jgi:hypothetical protein